MDKFSDVLSGVGGRIGRAARESEKGTPVPAPVTTPAPKPPTKRQRQLDKVARDAILGELEEAKKAGALAFTARLWAQVGLPHSNPKTNEFTRRNGAFTLTVMNTSAIGLPYGKMPRLLMCWVVTEAVKTQSRELHLGDSLSAFMRALGLPATGGKTGSIGRLRNQMRRLFTSTISFTLEGDNALVDEGFRLSDYLHVWWSPHDPDQRALWESTVVLSEQFYKTATERPVPLDVRVLRALRSPLAVDLYTWMTYRNSYLKKPTEIPWAALQMQFGTNYARTRDFKAKLVAALQDVTAAYPYAKVEEGKRGLVLKPSPTNVKRLT